MKTGVNMEQKSNNVHIDLRPEQNRKRQQRNNPLCIALCVIMAVFIAVSIATLVTYFFYLNRADIKEKDAVFITNDGVAIPEHIKLTESEAIFSSDDSTLIYDYSKGLKVYHWQIDNAAQDACYVESFNVSKFTTLGQLKSMMKNVKTDKPNHVERNIEESFIATDITLNNLAMGPASKTLCKNKNVIFLQRVPTIENTDLARVRRDRIVIKKRSCILFILCVTKKTVIKVNKQ